jgi:hypothetical protein
MENLDDAGLSAAAVTFSPGEKFIEDCRETQFFTGAVSAALLIGLSTSLTSKLLTTDDLSRERRYELAKRKYVFRYCRAEPGW